MDLDALLDMSTDDLVQMPPPRRPSPHSSWSFPRVLQAPAPSVLAGAAATTAGRRPDVRRIMENGIELFCDVATKANTVRLAARTNGVQLVVIVARLSFPMMRRTHCFVLVCGFAICRQSIGLFRNSLRYAVVKPTEKYCR